MSVKNGGLSSGYARYVAAMCPRMWCTGMNGLFIANASDLPKFAPTSSAPIRPGAQVAATASTSCLSISASRSACSVTRTTASMCRREAISGTTPPYSACVAICVSTTLDKIFRPSSMTAAAVSSHEDSIASILMVILLMFSQSSDSFPRLPDCRSTKSRDSPA